MEKTRKRKRRKRRRSERKGKGEKRREGVLEEGVRAKKCASRRVRRACELYIEREQEVV